MTNKKKINKKIKLEIILTIISNLIISVQYYFIQSSDY